VSSSGTVLPADDTPAVFVFACFGPITEPPCSHVQDTTPATPDGCVLIAQGKCQRLSDSRGYVKIVGDLDPDTGFVVVEHHSGNMSAPCIGGTVQTHIVPTSTCSTKLQFDDFSYFIPFDDDVSSQV
jgi:hypothetical protein